MSEAASNASETSSAQLAMVETEKLVSILFDKLEGWITGFVQMLPNLVVEPDGSEIGEGVSSLSDHLSELPLSLQGRGPR